MTTSDRTLHEHANVDEAYAAFQAEAVNPAKSLLGKTSEGEDYNYAGLSDILVANRTIAASHGLYLRLILEQKAGFVALKAIIKHVSGGSIYFGQGALPAGPTAWTSQSAVTYLRKMMSSIAFGVAGEDDDASLAVKYERALDRATTPAPQEPAAPTPPAAGSAPQSFKMPAWKIKKIKDLASKTGQTAKGLTALLKAYGAAKSIEEMTREDSDNLIAHLETLKTKAKQS